MAKRNLIDNLLQQADKLFTMFFDDNWWVVFLIGLGALVVYILFQAIFR